LIVRDDAYDRRPEFGQATEPGSAEQMCSLLGSRT